jgi:two-component sensor histidine kinase/tetratricopeptide (TPR) repeat protein
LARTHTLLWIVVLLFFISCNENKKTSTPHSVDDKIKNEFAAHCSQCDSLKTLKPYKALEACDKALKTGTSWAPKKDLIEVLGNKATAYNFVGNYTEQLNTILKATELAKELNDIHVKIDVMRQLANCNYYLGNYQKTIDIDQKVFDISSVIHDTVLMAASLNNMGDAYKHIGPPEIEIQYYQRAIEYILDRNGNPRNKEYYYTMLGNMAVTYKKMRQYEVALKYCRLSMMMRKNLPHKGYYAGSLKDMGVIYYDLGRVDSAIYYHMQCIKEVKGIDGKEWLAESYFHLKYIYMKKERWDSAFKYQELFHKTENRRVNAQSIKEQTLLQTKYEYEKDLERERTFYEDKKMMEDMETQRQRYFLMGALVLSIVILILLGFNWVRYQKMKKLNAEMAVKNNSIANLMKEIHHRVKNNLQVISSMLNIQQRNIDDPALKTAFKDANSRINSMALVHQNLYEKENLDFTDAQEYFEQLFKAITASYAPRNAKIVVQVKAKDIKLNIDTLIPLALIVNELLTNSYKYAFVEKTEGIIHFELAHREGMYDMKFTDSGSGFPPGFKLKQSKGLGSLMIEQLTTQLFGTYDVKSSDTGVEYHFKFKGL